MPRGSFSKRYTVTKSNNVAYAPGCVCVCVCLSCGVFVYRQYDDIRPSTSGTPSRWRHFILRLSTRLRNNVVWVTRCTFVVYRYQPHYYGHKRTSKPIYVNRFRAAQNFGIPVLFMLSSPLLPPFTSKAPLRCFYKTLFFFPF